VRVYGKVATGFWQDEKVLPLSDRTKLLALYLLTGPHSNLLGCFRLPVGYISADLNWSPKAVRRGLAALARIGYLRRDEATGLTLLPNYFRYNTIENPNVGKRAAALIKGLPHDSEIMMELAAMLTPFADRLPSGLLEHLALSSQHPPRPSAAAPNDPAVKELPLPLSQAFTTFWDEFPTGPLGASARNRAAAAFERVVASGRASPDQLVEGARRYAAAIDPHTEKPSDPATWLAVEQWRRVNATNRKPTP